MTGSRQDSRNSYWVAFAAAVAVHAALFFGIRGKSDYVPPEYGVEVAAPGVEVDLVAALPAEVQEVAMEKTEPPQPEPEPEPPQPEPEPEPPQPEPEPEPPVVEPEIAIPKPEPATTPQPAATPQPTPAATPRRAPKPLANLRNKITARKRDPAVGDGSSAIPGNDATTASAARGALSAQPGYLRNPHPAYPEEARKAGQEGVVLLLVRVDERGHVADVAVARSSGFPLLDERALSTVRDRWSFRPARQGKVNIATEVRIPIRFTLDS